MVFTDTRQPSRTGMIQTFGEPYVPPESVAGLPRHLLPVRRRRPVAPPPLHPAVQRAGVHTELLPGVYVRCLDPMNLSFPCSASGMSFRS